jgi:hypothetical protein
MLLIQSARDEAALELAPLDEDFFLATLRSRGVSGAARVGTFMANGLGEFFRYFADNWRGWQGVKAWASLEGELSLTAESDRVGHVFLDVRLREGAPARWTLEANLVLEAGMLTELAVHAQEFESKIRRAT